VASGKSQVVSGVAANCGIFNSVRTFVLVYCSEKSLRPCGLFFTAKMQGREENTQSCLAGLSQSESSECFGQFLPKTPLLSEP
jgi:hypothetical protein